MAKPRTYRVFPHQKGESDYFYDLSRRAKVPGRRRSKSGRIYYEHRANRSDMPGSRL